MEYEQKELNISFWNRESGSMLTHKSGLDEKQIKFLQELKAGDRLILWKNDKKKSEYSPDFNLKIFRPKALKPESTEEVPF